MHIGIAHIRTLVSTKKIHNNFLRNVDLHRRTINVRP
jgi:hypothetical protein